MTGPRFPGEVDEEGARQDVIVVLGCPSGSAALRRRAVAGAAAFHARGASLIVACGGRAWSGVVEADAIARILVAEGVPEAAVLRERCSVDTRDNARFAAALLGRRGLSRVVVVTCSWHLPRAERLFREAALEVVAGEGVLPPSPSLRQRLYWRARERVATWLERGPRGTVAAPSEVLGRGAGDPGARNVGRARRRRA